jgi:hypothetical protein
MLGIPLGTSSFRSSFIKYTLLKDVRPLDLLLKLGDVYVAFGIMLHTSFSTFIDSLISFDFSFLQVFGCLLGTKSFDSPKGPLARKQTSLPITFGDIGCIPTITITLTTYLGSWALVISIIIVRFMVNQCPFFFKTLAQVDKNTFFFQQHLKVACDFLLPPTWACFLPFEQLIGQKKVHFQDFISRHLHHHNFFKMLFHMILKAYCAQILSCFDPRASIWLIT